MTPARRNSRRGADPTAYTPSYAYRGPRAERELYCEDVALSRIAEAAGTPAYVYSRASIEAAYRRLDRAFGALPHTLCYAVKANSNLAVLRILARLGSSFDIVSGGELDRLRRIARSRQAHRFFGRGENARRDSRGADAIRERPPRRDSALQRRIGRGAGGATERSGAPRAAGGARPSLAIRVNPDVLAGGHPHISTGHHHHKFGVDWTEARRLYLAHKNSRWIAWRGISVAHRLADFERRAVPAGARAARVVRARPGARMEFASTTSISAAGSAFATRTKPRWCRRHSRGRWRKSSVRSAAGCCRAGARDRGPGGRAAHARALREGKSREDIRDRGRGDERSDPPVLYGAKHPITPAARDEAVAAPKKHCRCGRTRVRIRRFSGAGLAARSGRGRRSVDLWTAGAYGFVQSSNYNARRRAAEVLVEGRRFRVARRRETYDDLVRGETA